MSRARLADARAWVGVACLLVVGCGAETPGAVDAAVSDDARVAADGGAGLVIAAPAPPVLTPCATGWREVASDGIATCEPWPATGMAVCTSIDEAHFPGEPGCARIGTACPSGDFPEALPLGATVFYAKAGAAAGGDGSAARPFDTIAAAMARATPGAIVAIGKGEYDEPLMLVPGVTLWGACVAQTVLRSSTSAVNRGVLRVGVADVVVRNLRIGASSTIGIVVVGAGSHATVQDIVVENTTSNGIASAGGIVDARNVVVRDTQRGLDGRFGRGIEAQDDATLRFEHFVVRDVNDVGAYSSGTGASVQLVDGAIVGVVPSLSDDSGWGIGVAMLGSAEIERVVIERASDQAVGAFGMSFVARDSVFRDTRPDRAGRDGRGMTIGGATIELTRVLFERLSGSGVLAGTGATVTLADVVMRDIDVDPSTGTRGIGLQGQGATTAHVDRLDVRRFASAAIVAFDATFDVRDFSARDARGDRFGRFGRAISAESGASVRVERSAVEAMRGIAIYSGNPGTVMMLSDIVISETMPLACLSTTCPAEADGTGAGAYGSASLSMTRFAVRGAALCGAQVATGGAVDLATGEVRGAEIGACVQVDGYDLSRLSRDVLYVDNARAIESTTLPVPMSLGML